MNDRERFIACMLGEPVDRPPYWLLWAPWPTTWRRWQAEGMPAEFRGFEDVRAHFGAEAVPHVVPVNLGPCPKRQRTVLEETDEFVIFTDGWGIKRRDFKHHESMSEFIEFPVMDRAGWQLYQAPLGTKTHDYKDPTVGFEPKFLQIVGTMFRMMSIHRRIWPEVTGVQSVPVWGEISHLDPEPVPTTRQTLWQGFRKGVKRYRRNLNAILSDQQRKMLEEMLADERPDFPPEDWAHLVLDFGVMYSRGEGDPDKVALALLPMYYARKATMLRQLEGKPWTAVEEAIQAQASLFEEGKPYLIERWDSRLPWKPQP